MRYWNCKLFLAKAKSCCCSLAAFIIQQKSGELWLQVSVEDAGRGMKIRLLITEAHATLPLGQCISQNTERVHQADYNTLLLHFTHRWVTAQKNCSVTQAREEDFHQEMKE